MSMQVSIGQRGRTEEQEEQGIGHSAATWAVSVIDGLGRTLMWILARIRSAGHLEGKRKQMQLVESLMLGNRRQLLLVMCGNQRYLVGAGADSVGSILALDPVAASAEDATSATKRPGLGTRCSAKGLELVQPKGRRIVSEQEAGSGLWT